MVLRGVTNRLSTRQVTELPGSGYLGKLYERIVAYCNLVFPIGWPFRLTGVSDKNNGGQM